MADERKIREIYGVKSVLDEAAERIEATWREKLLRETGDLRSENALLRGSRRKCWCKGDALAPV